MNRWKKALFFIIPAIVLAISVLAAILFTPTEKPLKDPLAHYQVVVDNLSPQPVQASRVEIETVTKVSGQIFTEKTFLTIQHKYKDGQLQLTVADRTVEIGSYRYSVQERLENDIHYIDLAGNRFCGPADAATLSSQYPPTLLLTARNYTQITGTVFGGKITMEFREPVAAEEWALPKGAELISASGTLTTTKDGILLDNTYSITYKAGQSEVTQTFSAKPFQPETDISDDFDASGYTSLSVADAPLLLERMSGYLLQADYIESTYEEYIYCQTFGDQRSRDMELTISKAEPFAASLSTTATLVNSSRGEEVSSAKQVEIFKDGIYSRITGSEKPVADGSITQERFQTHCQDILVGTVLLPQFINNVEILEQEDSMTLLFTPTEALAGLLCEEACQSLYQDPTVLNATASSSITEALTAHLEIQKSTGLPLSSGIHYKGIYTITELPYRLEFTTDQSYFFAPK